MYAGCRRQPHKANRLAHLRLRHRGPCILRARRHAACRAVPNHGGRSARAASNRLHAGRHRHVQCAAVVVGRQASRQLQWQCCGVRCRVCPPWRPLRAGHDGHLAQRHATKRGPRHCAHHRVVIQRHYPARHPGRHGDACLGADVDGIQRPRHQAGEGGSRRCRRCAMQQGDGRGGGAPVRSRRQRVRFRAPQLPPDVGRVADVVPHKPEAKRHGRRRRGVVVLREQRGVLEAGARAPCRVHRHRPNVGVRHAAEHGRLTVAGTHVPVCKRPGREGGGPLNVDLEVGGGGGTAGGRWRDADNTLANHAGGAGGAGTGVPQLHADVAAAHAHDGVRHQEHAAGVHHMDAACGIDQPGTRHTRQRVHVLRRVGPIGAKRQRQLPRGMHVVG